VAPWISFAQDGSVTAVDATGIALPEVPAVVGSPEQTSARTPTSAPSDSPASPLAAPERNDF